MNYYSKYNNSGWLPSELYQIDAIKKYIETNNDMIQMENPIFESKNFKFSIIKHNYIFQNKRTRLYQYVVVYSTNPYPIKVQMIVI
jgi:hypothetical protein